MTDEIKKEMADKHPLIFSLSKAIDKRFDKVDDELATLYKRCNMLLGVDEQHEETVNTLLTVVENLKSRVDKMQTTLEHMKH